MRLCFTLPLQENIFLFGGLRILEQIKLFHFKWLDDLNYNLTRGKLFAKMNNEFFPQILLYRILWIMNLEKLRLGNLSLGFSGFSFFLNIYLLTWIFDRNFWRYQSPPTIKILNVFHLLFLLHTILKIEFSDFGNLNIFHRTIILECLLG